jgi:hypothetical protein
MASVLFQGGLWCFGGNGLSFAQSLSPVPEEKVNLFCLQALLKHSMVRSKKINSPLSHEEISAFSIWAQCGLLSPQSLANFAEIRFRSAIIPG